MGASTASDTALGLPSPVAARIADATLQLIGRVGVAKLTLDEVAREAGCGRATVYRTFPGGKDQVIAAAAERELARFLATVGAELDEAGSLEDLVTAALSGAARFAASSAPLLYLAVHEPEVILTHVAFDRVDKVFAVASGLLGPRLARFLSGDDVDAAAEWITRVALFHVCLPYAPIDLTDDDQARHLARTYLLPGLLRGPGAVIDLRLPTVSPTVSPYTHRS